LVEKNHALKTLIAAACNLNPRAISGGPEWVDSDRYDIVAKAPNEVRPNLDEQLSMLRKLLANRFQLGCHREQKELRVYKLTGAKGGPRLKRGHGFFRCLTGGAAAACSCGIASTGPVAGTECDHG
jgi:uncharacterized protein (TIGR03435 family)